MLRQLAFAPPLPVFPLQLLRFTFIVQRFLALIGSERLVQITVSFQVLQLPNANALLFSQLGGSAQNCEGNPLLLAYV